VSRIHIVEQYACVGNRRLDNENFYYISNGDWFIKGTRCDLETNYGIAGIFRGKHICVKGNGEVENCGLKEGEVRNDSESCMWEEFDIYDSKTNELLIKAEEYDDGNETI